MLGTRESRAPGLACDRRTPVAGRFGADYGPCVSGPVDMIDRPVPDLELPSSRGGLFRLRGRVGVGPLALFFYIRNATPG